MREVGETVITSTQEQAKQHRTTRIMTLRLMEQICDVVSAYSPRRAAVGLSILSEIVAGDSIRKICQTHNLLPSEVYDFAEEGLKTIRETLSHPRWAEEEFHNMIDEAKENFAKKKANLTEELRQAEERATEAKKKYAELEKDTVDLMSDPKRRNAYMRKVPFHRLPVSADLKNHAARCGFYTLGDVIDIHPYDLITKYKFTRPMIDDFEKYIKSVALERKIK